MVSHISQSVSKAFLHHVKLRWVLPFIIIKFEFEAFWSFLKHFNTMSIVVDAPFTIISNLNFLHFYITGIVVDAPYLLIFKFVLETLSSRQLWWMFTFNIIQIWI